MQSLNGYGFAAVIIQSVASLAWPAAIVACAYIFRSQITDLLPRLQIKHGTSEVSFSRIGELVEQVQVHEAQELIKASELVLTQPSAATANLATLPSDQIRLMVEDIALKMRELEERFRRQRDSTIHSPSRDWTLDTAAYLEQSTQQRHEWQTTLLPEAAALREEMIRRIGDQLQVDTRRTDFIFEHGSLAGASPLNDAALSLEQLARNLVGSSDKPPTLVMR